MGILAVTARKLFLSRAVLNVYEAVQMIEYGNILEWPPWAERLTRLNHVMLVTNSSVNIVIYVFQDFKFRRALWEHIMCLTISSRVEGRTRLRANHSFELVTIGTTAGQKEISMDASSDQRCYTVDTENAI